MAAEISADAHDAGHDPHLAHHFESPVQQLVMEKDRVVGVQLQADGSVERASHTVVTVPPRAAAALLPREMERERRFFDSILAHELEGTGVTANVLVPGGRANTRMIPSDGKFADRSLLIQPDVMVAPILWLASRATDAVNGRRFRAALFDPKLPPEEAAKAAGAPVAWRELGGQAIHYG